MDTPPTVPARPSGAIEPDESGEPGDLLRTLRSRTPARVLVGRAGGSYRTGTLLGLREDHAAATDAVRAEIDLDRDLGAGFVRRWGLFEVGTLAGSKRDYLLDPESGRRLTDAARAELARRCPTGVDVQVAIGDGLSAAAVAAQVPALLPLLAAEIRARGWRLGHPFFIRHCRVGILNDIGAALDPVVAVLLIGERPGLATAEGLSAYLAYRPRPGDTDARRNLISNIHARGVPPDQAARRIAALAGRMRAARAGGVAVKEDDGPSLPQANLPAP